MVAHGVGVTQAKPACKHTIATRKCYQYNTIHRVDIWVLDFSKAFDTVPHPHLLNKLEHLGIRGDLYHWLTYIIIELDQRVVMTGSYSNFIHVDSGIHQGTVL